MSVNLREGQMNETLWRVSVFDKIFHTRTRLFDATFFLNDVIFDAVGCRLLRSMMRWISWCQDAIDVLLGTPFWRCAWRVGIHVSTILFSAVDAQVLQYILQDTKYVFHVPLVAVSSFWRIAVTKSRDGVSERLFFGSKFCGHWILVWFTGRNSCSPKSIRLEMLIVILIVIWARRFRVQNRDIITKLHGAVREGEFEWENN